MKYKLTDQHNPDLLENIKITKSELNAGLDNLILALGENFIDDFKTKTQSKYNQNKKPKMEFHLLYDGLLCDVLNQKTIELLELSNYLKNLKHLDGYNDLIIGLKTIDDESFLNYFYQAAISYRLSKIVDDIRLEPLINGRTPDVSFKYLQNEYIGEMTSSSIGKLSDDLEILLKKMGDSINSVIKESGYKYVLLIQLKETNFLNGLDVYIKNVKEVISKKMAYKLLEDKFLKIEVIRFDLSANIEASVKDMALEKYCLGVRIGYAPAKDNSLSETYELDKAINLGGIMVDTNDLTFQDEYSRIESAIRRKIPQLQRFASKQRIVLFVNSEYKWSKLDTDRLAKKLYSNLLSKTSNIFEGIVITSRHHLKDGIHKYAYCTLSGSENDKDFISLTNELRSLEESKDTFLK